MNVSGVIAYVVLTGGMITFAATLMFTLRAIKLI